MPAFVNEFFGPDRWAVFVFITTRLIGLGLTAPLWSMPTYPRSVRAATIVVLALLLLPSVPENPLPETVLDIPLPLAMELVIGMSIGLTAAVIIQGVAYAGDVLSLQTGLSLGAALSGGDIPGAGLGQLKSVSALLIYVILGGHLIMLQGLAESLRVLPPGAPINTQTGGATAAAAFSVIFTSAARVAAPAMVALLLANIALAILSRAVPQLNVIMVSFPMTIGIGLLMIGISIPIVASAVNGWILDLPSSITTVIDGYAVEAGVP
jgi:flagellar biosynthetic protein FliR